MDRRVKADPQHKDRADIVTGPEFAQFRQMRPKDAGQWVDDNIEGSTNLKTLLKFLLAVAIFGLKGKGK